jgi:hypothetical protein
VHENFLCRVPEKNTRQRASLPSVKKTLKTLGKESLPSVFFTLDKYGPLPSVFDLALGPKKNTRQTTSRSAKNGNPVVYPDNN